MSEPNADYRTVREIATQAVQDYLAHKTENLGVSARMSMPTLDPDEIGQEVTWALARAGYVIVRKRQSPDFVTVRVGDVTYEVQREQSGREQQP